MWRSSSCDKPVGLPRSLLGIRPSRRGAETIERRDLLVQTPHMGGFLLPADIPPLFSLGRHISRRVTYVLNV